MSIYPPDERACVYVSQSEAGGGDPDGTARQIAGEIAQDYNGTAPVRSADGWYESNYVEDGVHVYLRVRVVNGTARIISYSGQDTYPVVMDVVASVKFD
jgi:hypothetical protein